MPPWLIFFADHFRKPLRGQVEAWAHQKEVVAGQDVDTPLLNRGQGFELPPILDSLGDLIRVILPGRQQLDDDLGLTFQDFLE